MAEPGRPRASSRLLLAALAALVLGGSSEHRAPDGWEFHEERDGIRVFTRDSLLPGLKTVRAETVIPIADPYVIVALLEDPEAAAELTAGVRSVEELESVEPGTRHMHMVLNVPWPLKDRDVAAALTLLHDEAGRRLILTLTGEPGLIPVDRKYVRVPRFASSYTLRYGRDDGVHVTLESTIDPGGSIPKRLVNYGITGMPLKTLSNMRRLVSRAKYHGQRERLRHLFRPI